MKRYENQRSVKWKDHNHMSLSYCLHERNERSCRPGRFKYSAVIPTTWLAAALACGTHSATTPNAWSYLYLYIYTYVCIFYICVYMCIIFLHEYSSSLISCCSLHLLTVSPSLLSPCGFTDDRLGCLSNGILQLGSFQDLARAEKKTQIKKTMEKQKLSWLQFLSK